MAAMAAVGAAGSQSRISPRACKSTVAQISKSENQETASQGNCVSLVMGVQPPGGSAQEGVALQVRRISV